MPRVAGVNTPDNKRVEIALTYIYGIGRSKSNRIISQLGMDKNIRAKDLSTEELGKLREVIEKERTEGELRHEVTSNVRRLRDIGAYRGLRHTRGLPVRGQQTKTNSRTVRGNKRVTMSSGKRSIEKK